MRLAAGAAVFAFELVYTVQFRDLDVLNPIGDAFCFTGCHDIVTARQCGALVGGAGQLQGRSRLPDNFLVTLKRARQSLIVDVHEHERAVMQQFTGTQALGDFFREAGAGPEHCDTLRHPYDPPRQLYFVQR